uniref:Uncharacterized protein n=1 Tax=Chromera velia CCMP2878 TaxID=1169474 RepID=A0A0G4HW94_9ALVE|eukprot:Cvel_1428.t1-p1 / transcript=Cvel_1428.t1 / gene=Cvel_1428 / organism=Chromera_velia_CCMP2878 / gene_product=hypothetical protein / transcript_product=hypothetical protein / location=Cvel_scaffold50:10960-19059(-) / protein_length=601 / sequence_SO=supercontig / SO=protein_coding / is_pseudo=false
MEVGPDTNGAAYEARENRAALGSQAAELEKSLENLMGFLGALEGETEKEDPDRLALMMIRAAMTLACWVDAQVATKAEEVEGLAASPSAGALQELLREPRLKGAWEAFAAAVDAKRIPLERWEDMQDLQETSVWSHERGHAALPEHLAALVGWLKAAKKYHETRMQIAASAPQSRAQSREGGRNSFGPNKSAGASRTSLRGSVSSQKGPRGSSHSIAASNRSQSNVGQVTDRRKTTDLDPVPETPPPNGAAASGGGLGESGQSAQPKRRNMAVPEGANKLGISARLQQQQQQQQQQTPKATPKKQTRPPNTATSAASSMMTPGGTTNPPTTAKKSRPADHVPRVAQLSTGRPTSAAMGGGSGGVDAEGKSMTVSKSTPILTGLSSTHPHRWRVAGWQAPNVDVQAWKSKLEETRKQILHYRSQEAQIRWNMTREEKKCKLKATKAADEDIMKWRWEEKEQMKRHVREREEKRRNQELQDRKDYQEFKRLAKRLQREYMTRLHNELYVTGTQMAKFRDEIVSEFLQERKKYIQARKEDWDEERERKKAERMHERIMREEERQWHKQLDLQYNVTELEKQAAEAEKEFALVLKTKDRPMRPGV